jgi:hypothetical protein
VVQMRLVDELNEKSMTVRALQRALFKISPCLSACEILKICECASKSS